MRIGSIIREHRKTLGITQEEMANRLGVTTPAVNKWENDNTLPDITLLAPIARLLGITTNELLSFKEELTAEEIKHLSFQIINDLKEKDFDTVFLLAKSKIEEYPSCEELILETACLLDTYPTILGKNIPNKENYEGTIIGWYKQCLNSKNEKVRDTAAQALFNIYYKKENYEMAVQYTKYFSGENTKCKFMEAMVSSKTGKRNEAYRIYEELLFSRLQSLNIILTDLFMMYKEDNNHEMVNKLASISSTIAAAFEMGRQHEVGHLALSAAVWEKDIEKTEQIMSNILDSIETITDFTKSSLYQHMNFNNMENDEIKALGFDSESQRKRVIASCKDKQFDYMRGNKWWEELISSDDN